jgi:hypothetical protein
VSEAELHDRIRRLEAQLEEARATALSEARARAQLAAELEAAQVAALEACEPAAARPTPEPARRPSSGPASATRLPFEMIVGITVSAVGVVVVALIVTGVLKVS